MAESRTVIFLYLCLTLILLCRSQENTITYHLYEEQDKGTFVGNVARDALLYGSVPEEEFRRLKFTFFTTGNPFVRFFTIDEKTSTIRTTRKIDREKVCPFKEKCLMNIDIAVYIRDARRNIYDLKELYQVKIILNDLNDNPPMFPQESVSISVSESVPVNHILLTSGAVDKDTGVNNSVMSYDIVPVNGIFGLKVIKNYDGTSDLGLVVKHKLDRETRDFFQVIIVAKDGGYPQKTGSVTVNISITDYNDNRPAFLQATYTVSIPENYPINATILTVSAVDQDANENGKISYHFSSRVSDKIRKAVSIDSKSGKVLAKGPINYEVDKQFQFMIEARDHGTPPLPSLAAVIINIVDVNDNAPHISINLAPEGADIPEGMETGKFIAHVSVSDGDSGRNAQFDCRMDDDHFALEKFYDNIDNIFKIILNQRLDHETTPSLKVTITCTDKGDPPLSNSTSFIVTVLDENDNTPIFSKSLFTGSIIENNAIGEEILRTTATDWDSLENGRLTYSLDSKAKSSFTIDPDLGIIKAGKVIDREKETEFRFHVIATDHGDSPKSSSAEVIITVDDQNDQPPKFTKHHFTFYLPENKHVGFEVGNITAVDLDQPKYNNYLFSISADSNVEDLFSLDPWAGRLTTSRKFDHEVDVMFNFTVFVQDPQVPSFTDSANVTVVILNANDHKPTITVPTEDNNTITVSAGTKPGTVLITIKAYDSDDLNAKLAYQIRRGNKKKLFELDRETGVLSVAENIEKADAGLYKLLIFISDDGSPVQTSHIVLNIIVPGQNSTAVSGDGDPNMLVVIILVSVTSVLTIAIVTTICMIKHIDRERQHASVVMLKGEEEKMFGGKRGSFSSVSTDSNENKDGLKKKKEVSFSLEEEKDVHNISGSSGIASFTTFRNPNDSQTDTLELHKNSYQPMEKDIPLQTNPDKHWGQHEAHNLLEILKRPELEEKTETGTSDSGHGGSEEDLTTNCPDLGEEARQFYPTAFHGGSGRATTTVDKKPPRNHGNSNNKKTVITPRKEYDLRAPENRFPSHSQSFDNMFHYNTAPRSHQYGQTDTLHTFGRSQTPNDLTTFSSQRKPFSSQSTHCSPNTHCPPKHPNFMPASQWRADLSLGRDSDRRTMATGCAVNPDDLKQEIDQLFFKDAVV
ncbi:protocadherin-11 X-linked-like isoform X2 [Gigantopelta aegis]|uniref:protocadherin-11 X-linked-like isoform X2 n=1 Tax=Gigantopelta aegis TaxID=1735272 RepID=UPI001B88A1B8|nr:protocadherin-11 X-linked-like isoform X2 [Gigantopelta aegis]